jgi:hypothetical protein
MRIAPAAATLLAVLSLTGAALACEAAPRPTFTPVITDPGNGDRGAQRLLRAAAEADAAANRDEIAARSADRRADSFEISADSAFERASFTEGLQRSRLLAEGRAFQDAAVQARAEADRGFQRAAQSRRRARELRLQASNLAGGGGGWRGRPVRQVADGQFM